MMITGYVKDYNGNLIGGAKVRAYKRNTYELLGECVSDATSGEIIYGDPYHDNVVLLLNMENGENNSTAIKDLSIYNKNIECLSGALLRTDIQRPNQLSSCYFNNGNGYLQLNNAEINFPGDFSIDGYFYLTNSTAYQWLLAGDTNAAGYMGIALNYPSANYISMVRLGVVWVLTFDAAILPTNTFFHLEICRYNGLNYLFINGILIGSPKTETTNWIFPTNIWIGKVVGYSSLIGNCSAFRMTKGIARHTASFDINTVNYTINKDNITTELGKYHLNTNDYSGNIDVIAQLPDSLGIRNDLSRKIIVTP